jgi:excisionase family DNA binding protein
METNMTNDDQAVLKVQDLADYLRVHPSTIYRLLKRNLLPTFKVGSDWRFNKEQIDEWRLSQGNLPMA